LEALERRAFGLDGKPPRYVESDSCPTSNHQVVNVVGRRNWEPIGMRAQANAVDAYFNPVAVGLCLHCERGKPDNHLYKKESSHRNNVVSWF
jgi:hypothetical protein